ncbi:YggS family pyridoxal phosphate-dependent enzyme [Modestobacter sp. I12A-02628]|uniref:Pyridoxal phosphate homeostasis protein n=1 Tax=Goekera deserti TaxID=2497753 RepID=A0A7K3WAD4_9ACTN|nr:YggS family pyridoxal phosphate enzyme [Goekera deserti]MPQ99269.1 YggS family pyridoxal phosphate-dependent enzyme [Goekera deserti]NDI47604.1 YggS family pyridoxal phosphate-dependent enzyme [Goekera deserti]NDI47667.1 YggS family pyridoxal phosphate-dependent enzyme [Goekera deserti]NEL53415.1 YggS family pyridoxal phosphate enzyme [Goekera deserti]
MNPLESNLRSVRQRIDEAARAAGRDPGDVSLLAVSKTWPADDVRALAALGQVDFAENKAQELTAKAAELADLTGTGAGAGCGTGAGAGTGAGEQGQGTGAGTVRWHFVGQLQRNKVNAVVAQRAVVHSVDSARLLDALSRAGERDERPVEVFLQVDLTPGGPDPARGGAPISDTPALADHAAELRGVTFRGLMAVAPRAVDPAAAFGALAELAHRVRTDHPRAIELSAGMSGDLEQAVAAGATMVRVGTAIFGARPLASG